MLGKQTVITTIAVHDMENAADFYGNVLGLKAIGENKAGLLFKSGDITIGLYESATAGTGQSTCLWWVVDDVEMIVADLESKGVVFDTNYDLPYAERSGNIYLLGDGMKAAWFRDIDGNILGVGNY